jgi:hypothetical protein
MAPLEFGRVVGQTCNFADATSAKPADRKLLEFILKRFKSQCIE